MRVLVACEFSGIVRDAFIKCGHQAISCDLMPSERPGPHIRGDVTRYLDERWDLIIAHPPCTYLCNSGFRWLLEYPDRWVQFEEAAAFFMRCLNSNAKHVAVENPIMHKYALEYVGRKPDFTIQPYEFGHNHQKRTCFWTRNLPALTPTKIMSERIQYSYLLARGADRWKLRSKTYQGVADAMAEQWSIVQTELSLSVD